MYRARSLVVSGRRIGIEILSDRVVVVSGFV